MGQLRQKAQEKGAGLDSALSNMVERPEMFVEAVAELSYKRALFATVRAAGLDDFSLEDVENPTMKRTRQVSGV